MKTTIFEDKAGYTNLQKEVAGTCKDCNNLITAFNEYGLNRVTSLQDVENLIADPIEHFDSPLLAKVTPIPGLQPNPEKLAELYDIDRPAYLVSVFGEKVIRSGSCVNCLPDIEVLTDYSLHLRFESCQDYLQFKNGKFTVDQVKIAQAREQYITYADERQEKALTELKTFVSLCNRFADCGLLTTAILESMKLFSYSHDNHRLNMPYDKLQLITKIISHEQN